MKIGIDISRANRQQKTGVEWYVYFLIQELKKLDWNGHKVILYSDSEVVGELAQLPDNWRIKVLRWPPKRFWTQIRLSWEMFRHEPDLLFIPAHVLPLVLPKHSIMTVHDIAAVRFPEAYNLFERWFSVWSAKRALKRCDTVLTPSAFTKQELGEYFALPTKTVVVTPLGFDNSYAGILKDEKLLPAQLRGKKYILTIGRKEEKKNTARLVQAFAHIKKQHPELQLVLVGKEGYGYEAVEQTILHSPYKSDIIELPWTETSELQQILLHAQVFVFPSLYEGFGIPVLEAWAAGTPVVCSNTTSLKELATPAAVLVDPLKSNDIAGGIEKVLKHPDFAEELVKKGKNELQKYSWEQLAKKTYQVLIS